VEIWPSGRAIVRCHDSTFGATEFNPGLGQGRFHPFKDSEGDVVPTLYGASTLEGALSESVFHNVPIRGSGRAIRHSALLPLLVSGLAPDRDLRLAQLHGFGLGRLGVQRAELIDSEARHYPRTAAWAAAIQAWRGEVDGMVWVSRLHDTTFALILFGDRVARGNLRVVQPPVSIFQGEGFAEVQRAAEQAGIRIL